MFFVLVFHLFLTNTLPRKLGDPGVSTESLPHSECSKQTNRKKNLFHFFGVFALFLVLLLYLPDSSPATWSAGLGTTHLHLAFGRGSSSLRPGQRWGGGGEGTGRGEIFQKQKKRFKLPAAWEQQQQRNTNQILIIVRLFLNFIEVPVENKANPSLPGLPSARTLHSVFVSSLYGSAGLQGWQPLSLAMAVQIHLLS